jgi:hypothetical protein
MDKQTEDKVVKLRNSEKKPQEIFEILKKEGKRVFIDEIRNVIFVTRRADILDFKKKDTPSHENSSSLKRELLAKAEKFWAQDENKSKTPDKNTLPYLLIPKYGMATTKALIYASIHLKKEKQLLDENGIKPDKPKEALLTA